MKKTKLSPYLITIPVFFFFSGFIIKDAGGPYFLNYYDPSYVYLINSLNLMQFNTVGHFDHPGTTVQLLGALILRINFLFTSSNDEIVKEVFSNPEKYLELINRCFVCLNSIALLFLGFIIFRLSDNIYTAMLLQFSPFVSFQMFYGLAIVAPENLIILVSIFFVSIIFYYLFKVNPENQSLYFIILFGIICGLGTVTKMTFTPLWIIPFILIKKFRNKIIFVISGIATFVFFFLPAISNYKSFIAWVQNLIFNPKVHGTFEANPFQISMYLDNLLTVFKQDTLLIIIYILMLTMIVINIFSSSKSQSAKKKYLVLIAIFVGISAQILLVAKNYLPYTQYYLIPSFMLLTTGLYVAVNLIYDRVEKFSKRIAINHFYISLVLLLGMFSIILLINSYNDAVKYRNEAYSIRNKIINDFKNELVIPSFMSANDDCALALTVFHDYGGENNERYKGLLANKLRTEIYYIAWTNSFFTIPSDVNIKEKILAQKKIIVQLFLSVTSLEKFSKFLRQNYGIETKAYKEILTNQNGESIYEIELKGIE